MSGGDHGAYRLEPCIFARKGGTFRVQATYQYNVYQASFPTLKEARAFRDSIHKGQVPVRGGNDRRDTSLKQSYVPMDTALDARERKRVIREAKKNAETVIRGGKPFKLVKL